MQETFQIYKQFGRAYRFLMLVEQAWNTSMRDFAMTMIQRKMKNVRLVLKKLNIKEVFNSESKIQSARKKVQELQNLMTVWPISDNHYEEEKKTQR